MKILIRTEITILVVVGVLMAVKFFVPMDKLIFWKTESSTEQAQGPDAMTETGSGIGLDGENENEAPGEIETAGDTMAEQENASEPKTDFTPVIDMTNRTDIEVPEEVTAKLAELTTEQKVAQLFLVSPEALAGTGLVEKAGSRTESGIKKHPVGGVVYSSANGRTDKQLSKIISETQKLFEEDAPLPIIVGGAVGAGKTEMALSTSTSADPIIPVIVKKSASAALEGSEEAKELEGFDSKTNGYSIYRCLNLNILTGTKPDTVVKALLQNGDLVYVTSNLDKSYNAVLKAIENNEIGLEELDAIAGRVIAVKMAMPQQATTLVE